MCEGQGPAAACPCRECAEGWLPEVLAGEEAVGRRAEEEGRPPDVFAGEEAEGRPPEVLAGEDEGGGGPAAEGSHR